MTKATTLFAALVALAFAARPARGQEEEVGVNDGATPLALEPGAPAGAFALSGFETVNLFNGNLNFRLPLLTVSGRGEAGTTLTLPIERRWSIRKTSHHDSNPTYRVDENSWSPLNPGYGPGILAIRYAVQDVIRNGQNQITHQVSLTRLTFIGPDGTETEFRDQALGGAPKTWHHGQPPINRGTVFTSTDGSAATFLSDTDILDVVGSSSSGKAHQGRLIFRDGTEYRVGNGQVKGRGLVHSIRDRNGNRMSFLYDLQNRLSEITDSLDRKVKVAYPANDTDVITYYGFRGDGGQNGQRTIVVFRAPLHELLSEGTVQTNQALFGDIGGGLLLPNQPFDPAVVAWVELPNGTKYDFWYNAYGELTRVQLPTGGLIEYTWASGTENPSGLYYVPAAWEWIPDYAIHRRVTSRKVYNYSELEQWTEYVVPADCDSSEGICVDVRHLAPGSGALLGRERHYFVNDPLASFNQSPCDYPGWRDGRETVVEIYDPAGNLLRATANTWEQRTNVAWWPGPPDREPPNDVRLTKAVTILDTHESSKVRYAYDDYGNVTRKDEFDYGAGTPSRSTETSYEAGTVYVHPYWAHIRDLPKVEKVWEGTALRSHREYFYDEGEIARPPAIHLEELPAPRDPYRGNLTRIWRYLDTPRPGQPPYVETSRTFDATGNVLKTVDPEGHSTTIEYVDNYGGPNGGFQDQTGFATYAFPTRSWNAKGHETRTQYDYYLGRPVDRMDANGVVTSLYYDDPLDRLTLGERVSNPGWTNYLSRVGFGYEDGRYRRRVHTYQDRAEPGGADEHHEIEYDELGREWNAFSHVAGTKIATRSRYDARGRRFMVQAPGPDSEDGPWTTTEFDILDRPRRVVTPDNAKVLMDYEGALATVTDPMGRVKQSRTDALGRVVEVVEDALPGGLNLGTVYEYDALDNVTFVRQPPQFARYFEYDTLGRMTKAGNPESGEVSYAYNRAGNLVQRKDARGWKTITSYDSLNRPSLRRYEWDGGATPEVSYTYDADALPGTFPKGRLTRVANAVSETAYHHDPLGRVIRSTQTTNGRSYSFSYEYDRADNLTREVYPSLRAVETTYDDLNRVTGVSGKGQTFASAFSYAPHGAVTRVRLGNGLWETARFNSRLQPESVGLGHSATTSDLLSLGFKYWPEGAGAPSNDGNVWKQTIVAGGITLTQKFVYDGADRLKWAFEPGGWTQVYDYDRWGNRAVTGSVLNPGLTPQDLVQFNPANNQVLLGSTLYDLAGNQVRDALGRILTYDAENRQTSFAGATYAYDGEGRRVSRSAGGVTTVFVHDALGRLAAEYVDSPSPPPPTRYLTLDPLGCTRVVTDEQGAVKSRRDYFPFGEEIPALLGPRLSIGGYGASDGVKQRFTGKERDLESGLDYFGGRYFSGAQARFMSPDPGNAGSNPLAPQSWNAYAYVLNNPLKYVDPTGESATLAGAVIGGVAGAGSALVRGALSGQMPSGREVAAAAAGGAVYGGMMGSVIDTGGATLPTVLGAGALAGVAATAAQNAVLGQATSVSNVAEGVAQGIVGSAMMAPAAGGPAVAAVAASSEATEVSTLKPGPFAGESISASGPGRTFTAAERAQIDKIGAETGCHTCGTTNPGTKSGHFVPDHQPPSALAPPGVSQRLYPHCTDCAFPRQANEVLKELKSSRP